MAEIVKKGADNPLMVSPKVPGIPSSMIENCERKYGMARASAHHITIIVTNQYLQRKAFMLDKISLSG